MMTNEELLPIKALDSHSQQALEYEVMLKQFADNLRDQPDESQIMETAMMELIKALKVGYFNNVHGSDSPNVATTSLSFLVHSNSTNDELSTVNGGTTSPPQIGNAEFPKRQLYEWEMQLVQQVAAECTWAIRQARLYQKQKARIEELEKLNRDKDDFLSLVVHELRSPMAGIRLAIQTLQHFLYEERTHCGETADFNTHSSKSGVHFQILHDECERAINLINDLLDLQRIEDGSEFLELTTIQLQNFLEEVTEPFQWLAQSRQQSLNIELEPNLPPFVTDSTCLRRILSELLNNACKYTPSAGTITLTALTESSALRLQVSNSGVEIPPHELPRIFDKFYRIPKSDIWKQGGTGLGLAIVRRLVAHLGGEIQVKSATKQTCFTVELPIS